MNAISKLVLLGAGLALVMPGTVAQAQGTPEFTFTVPVRVENLHPEVRGIQIHCVAQKRANDSSAQSALGSGTTRVAVTNRNFSGDVVVPVFVPRGGNGGPTDIRAYSCDLRLEATRAGGQFDLGSVGTYESFAGHHLLSSTAFWTVTGVIAAPAAAPFAPLAPVAPPVKK